VAAAELKAEHLLAQVAVVDKTDLMESVQAELQALREIPTVKL
jgi:hypothetical protein